MFFSLHIHTCSHCLFVQQRAGWSPCPQSAWCTCALGSTFRIKCGFPKLESQSRLPDLYTIYFVWHFRAITWTPRQVACTHRKILTWTDRGIGHRWCRGAHRQHISAIPKQMGSVWFYCQQILLCCFFRPFQEAKHATLHLGEGPISCVRWRGPLVAWATQKGVKLVDVETQQKVPWLQWQCKDLQMHISNFWILSHHAPTYIRSHCDEWLSKPWISTTPWL